MHRFHIVRRGAGFLNSIPSARRYLEERTAECRCCHLGIIVHPAFFPSPFVESQTNWLSSPLKTTFVTEELHAHSWVQNSRNWASSGAGRETQRSLAPDPRTPIRRRFQSVACTRNQRPSSRRVSGHPKGTTCGRNRAEAKSPTLKHGRTVAGPRKRAYPPPSWPTCSRCKNKIR